MPYRLHVGRSDYRMERRSPFFVALNLISRQNFAVMGNTFPKFRHFVLHVRFLPFLFQTR